MGVLHPERSNRSYVYSVQELCGAMDLHSMAGGDLVAPAWAFNAKGERISPRSAIRGIVGTKAKPGRRKGRQTLIVPSQGRGWAPGLSAVGRLADRIRQGQDRQ